MHPIHDVDVLLLLALMVAAKRRPAALAEILAAIDLQQGALPSASKLVDAFARLSRAGLVRALAAEFALTPEAEKLLARAQKPAETAARLFAIRERLAGYQPPSKPGDAAEASAQSAPSAPAPPIALDLAVVSAALQAHGVRVPGAAKNVLVPKPKPAEPEKARPGQRQRKPFAPRRRPG